MLSASKHSVVVAASLAVTTAFAQQAYDLDTAFRTAIEQNYVNSVAVLQSGKLLVSGRMRFTGEGTDRYLARLNEDGSRDVAFSDALAGGGRIDPWVDQFYVQTGSRPRRLFADGTLDPSYETGFVPMFAGNQPGDYHVYPDGRVLISGGHSLNDPEHGFVGEYNLIWFTNTGYLDTTRPHRRCNGTIYDIEPLPDGKFLLSGVFSTYEDQPVGRIIRVFPDGALDTTFHTDIFWGQAVGYHVQPDGKFVAAGRFLFSGEPDTLHLIRLLPDGQLDTSFNNHLRSASAQNGGFYPWVGIYPVSATSWIVFGAFRSINEQPRGGIAVVDTSGQLTTDILSGSGCGTWDDQGLIKGSISGIVPTSNGQHYIWGSYHGYDDGTTNDTEQRMVSRLYGLDVGVQERDRTTFQLYPNPAATQVTVQLKQVPARGELAVRDALGRVLLRQRTISYYTTLALHGASSGVYMVELWDAEGRIATQRLVVE